MGKHFWAVKELLPWGANEHINRVLIVKPGLDGHDRGAKFIARAISLVEDGDGRAGPGRVMEVLDWSLEMLRHRLHEMISQRDGLQGRVAIPRYWPLRSLMNWQAAELP